MAENKVRQNYHKESEEAVNQQINLELYAFYTYTSMVRSPDPSPSLFLLIFPPFLPSPVLLL